MSVTTPTELVQSILEAVTNDKVSTPNRLRRAIRGLHDLARMLDVQAAPTPFVLTQVECAMCLACGRQIRPEQIVTRLRPERGVAWPVQNLYAACDCCGAVYRMKRVLQSGSWQPFSPPERETDAAVIASIGHEIERRHGVRRIGEQQ